MYEVIESFGHYEIGKLLNISDQEQALQLIKEGYIKPQETKEIKPEKVKTKELKITTK
jgi:hypothetical protein